MLLIIDRYEEKELKIIRRKKKRRHNSAQYAGDAGNNGYCAGGYFQLAG